MALPAAIIKLIEASGNTFHAKVARWLAEAGWSISVSPYYLDQSQQKARELDLVAEKLQAVRDGFGHWKGELVVRLFVECKYVASDSVFWFTHKNRQAVEAIVCSSGGFRPTNAYTAQHHYLASGDRAAKLFASSNARGQESEPFYKALNQTLNGLVALRQHRPLVNAATHVGKRILSVLNFPVVVCSAFDRLYAVDFDGRDAPTRITDNLQLEVQYAYVETAGQSRNEFFLVDFVAFDQLAAFSASIQKDGDLSAILVASH